MMTDQEVQDLLELTQEIKNYVESDNLKINSSLNDALDNLSKIKTLLEKQQNLIDKLI